MIGTAKLNELDPEAYLRYLLERIADQPINRIEQAHLQTKRDALVRLPLPGTWSVSVEARPQCARSA